MIGQAFSARAGRMLVALGRRSRAGVDDSCRGVSASVSPADESETSWTALEPVAQQSYAHLGAVMSDIWLSLP